MGQTILILGAVVVVIAGFVLARTLLAKFARRKQLLVLEEAALATLLKANLSDAEYMKEVMSIRELVTKENKTLDSVEMLGAYARMLHACKSFDIMMAVLNMKYMQIGKTAQSLSVPMLTVDHIRAFHVVSNAVGDSISDAYEDLIDLGRPAGKLGVYAMEHPEDADLIAKVITDRRIEDLESIIQVVAEIKAAPSAALAEGAL